MKQSTFAPNSVISLGGNQYKVTMGTHSRTIDLDGMTCISDDDYNELENRGIDTTEFYAPMHFEDKFEKKAVEYVINYSAFDIDEYTSNYLDNTPTI